MELAFENHFRKYDVFSFGSFHLIYNLNIDPSAED